MVNTRLTAALLAASTATAMKDIPSLGLGTWLSDREKVPHAVEFGLKNGYDHIDAAWIYRKSSHSSPFYSTYSDIITQETRTKQAKVLLPPICLETISG